MPMQASHIFILYTKNIIRERLNDFKAFPIRLSIYVKKVSRSGPNRVKEIERLRSILILYKILLIFKFFQLLSCTSISRKRSFFCSNFLLILGIKNGRSTKTSQPDFFSIFNKIKTVIYKFILILKTEYVQCPLGSYSNAKANYFDHF